MSPQCPNPQKGEFAGFSKSPFGDLEALEMLKKVIIPSHF